MKIEKSNNPVAAGALILVLAVIVGRILWMVLDHGGPAAAAATISAVSPALSGASVPAANAVPTPKIVRSFSAAAPVTARNPFSIAIHSVHTVPSSFGLQRRSAEHLPAAEAEIKPFTSLAPFPARFLGPGSEASAKQPPAPDNLHAFPFGASPRGERRSKAQDEPMLKLTATVGGTEPMAVVQTTAPEPIILHVGDLFDGMRVMAIHEQEVIFARQNGFWTLPLQSANSVAAEQPAESTAAGSAAVAASPAVSQPEIPIPAPEEKSHEPQ